MIFLVVSILDRNKFNVLWKDVMKSSINKIQRFSWNLMVESDSNMTSLKKTFLPCWIWKIPLICFCTADLPFTTLDLKKHRHHVWSKLFCDVFLPQWIWKKTYNMLLYCRFAIYTPENKKHRHHVWSELFCDVFLPQ